MTTTHPLALAWLERVERLGADLPSDVRAELLADLRDHLDSAVPAEADGAEVGAVLDRLGDPAEVVAAARVDSGLPVPAAPPPQSTASESTPDGLLAQEVVALAALVLAGLSGIFVWPLTILLWAIGIALVAVSGRWRGGEVVAMVLLPVVWALPVLSMVVPVGSTVESCVADSSGMESCTEQTSGVAGPWALVAAIAVLVLIILGTRWLARAPRGRPTRG